MRAHVAGVIAGGIIVTAGLAALAQQRDVPVTPVAGDAQLAGRVMSGDASPMPVRRAIVSIAGGALESARAAITDDEGRFTFTSLPAGSYSISAKKAAWLPAESGASRPGRPGSRIALAAGEKRTVAVTMFRGAAISGVLRHPSGAPLAGVNVYALPARALREGDRGQSEAVLTNDRGEFRIYGLSPGEYVITAVPAPGGSGEIGARSAAATDALLAALTQRQSAPGVAGNSAPPITPAPAAGYAPIYFPGTPLPADAQRIRLGAGEEPDSLSFEVTRVPVAAIEGTLSGNVPNLAGVQMAIVPEVRELRMGTGAPSIVAVPPNELGEFKYANLAPGRYQVVGRALGGPPEPVAGAVGRSRGGGAGSAVVSGTGETLYAVADVEIRGEDVKGLSLALQPGGSISGTVVFDSGGTPPPASFGAVRVAVTLAEGNYMYSFGGTRIGNMLSDVPAVNVRPDGTFRIAGLGPARYTITCMLPPDLAKTWTLRSVTSEGRDLLDTSVVGMSTNLRDVKVTLSDKKTQIAGSLQSVSGMPTNEYFVVAFSADRANWLPGSRRSLSARPATDGSFVFSDLPAGEYFIAALSDLDPLEWQDAAFLAQVAPSAIKVTLAEGEKKIQDLRVK
jgi:uncharacterized protein (DUF2141 family)